MSRFLLLRCHLYKGIEAPPHSRMFAMRRAGYQIDPDNHGRNPDLTVAFREQCYHKIYEAMNANALAAASPSEGYAKLRRADAYLHSSARKKRIIYTRGMQQASY